MNNFLRIIKEGLNTQVGEVSRLPFIHPNFTPYRNTGKPFHSNLFPSQHTIQAPCSPVWDAAGNRDLTRPKFD